MKTLKYLSLAILIFSMTSCMNDQQQKSEKASVEQEYIPAIVEPDTIMYVRLDDSLREIIRKRGKKIIYAAGFGLKKELKLAIRNGGPVNAISFCYTRAMEYTDSISMESKLQIKRLAVKNRNPLNAMNENEQNLYKSYILNYIGGQGPYESISWNDAGNPIYYYPIYVDPVCLNCHGTVGTEVNPEVAEKIAQLYPDDKATGFKKGDPRGLWSVTFPEYIVTDVDPIAK